MAELEHNKHAMINKRAGPVGSLGGCSVCHSRGARLGRGNVPEAPVVLLGLIPAVKSRFVSFNLQTFYPKQADLQGARLYVVYRLSRRSELFQNM